MGYYVGLATIVTKAWVVKFPDNFGWIGLRSVPMTTAEGCISAEEDLVSRILGVVDWHAPNSIAHKPVPVPISRTL